MSTTASVDLDALLVALVLDPATYSRNRFFDLYTRSDVRRVRRRAMQLRSIVRHIARANWASVDGLLECPASHKGKTALSYEVPAVMLRRTTLLDELDLCLLRVALGQASVTRASGQWVGLLPTEHDKSRIDAVLARLAPTSVLRRAATLGAAPEAQDCADTPSAKSTLPV
jgi:hypothetical protein